MLNQFMIQFQLHWIIKWVLWWRRQDDTASIQRICSINIQAFSWFPVVVYIHAISYTRLLPVWLPTYISYWGTAVLIFEDDFFIRNCFSDLKSRFE